MANRKLLLTVIVTIVILSCLHETVQAKNRTNDATELTRSLLRDIEVVTEEDNLYNPVRIFLCIVAFGFRAVTYPIRTVYSLIFNLLSAIALLMLGCKVIPVTRCFDVTVDGVMEQIMNGVHEELQFFASIDSTPAS